MYKVKNKKDQNKAYRTLALTRKTLLWLGDEFFGGESDVSPLWFRHTGRNRTLEEKLYAERAEIKAALKALRRRKFLEIRKDGNKVWCRLTEKGKQASLRDRVRLCEKLPDGYVCMLSFDVPEQEREVRQEIRRLLKDCGFKMDHKSVWITDKDVFAPFSEYMKDLGMFKWFHVYEARILK